MQCRPKAILSLRIHSEAKGFPPPNHKPKKTPGEKPMETGNNGHQQRPWRSLLAVYLTALLVIHPIAGGLLRADEVTTLTSVADSYLDQQFPGSNNGTSGTLDVQSRSTRNRRAILRFDLSSITAGSAVKTSVLSLFLNSAPSASRTHAVHRVAGTTQWTETGVTWNSRNGTTNWTSAGGDFNATAAATATSGTTSNVTITWNVLSDGSVLNIPQNWLDTPSSNLGLTVKDTVEDDASGFLGQYLSREQNPPPRLAVHYLRNVTLGNPTIGISEVTHSWTFPLGSTSSNYNGVLFSKLQGSTPPSNTPSDGTAYLIGDTVAASETVGINTSSFTTTSATDENGENSVVLPGTTYAYKAFTHDDTTIIGAASATPPHYSNGVASGNVATSAGGGTQKKWSYLTSATTLAAPGLDPGVIVVTGSNDNKVHSMSATNGGRNYQPRGATGTTSGAIQSRPPVIASTDTSNTTCANVCDIVFVGAGDGKVYAFRTDTGQQLWASPLLTNAGGQIQGAPALQLKAFSGAGYPFSFDLVIVGTRNLGDTTGNKIYGLNGNTGAVVWTFAPGNLDIINSTPMLDPFNNAVWVTSRAGGGAHPSLWKLSTATGNQLAAITLTTTNKDVDSSPVLNLDESFLYATTNGGDLLAVDTSTNTVYSTNVGSGSGVGFPIPSTVGGTDELYFSTTVGGGTVHKRIFDRTAHTFTVGWNTALGAASTPMQTFPPLALAFYVGAGDGRLHKLDPASGADVAQRTVRAGATIGDPSFDTTTSRLYVGDSSGRIYAFDAF